VVRRLYIDRYPTRAYIKDIAENSKEVSTADGEDAALDEGGVDQRYDLVDDFYDDVDVDVNFSSGGASYVHE
jgi:hypothetical protein